MEPFGSNKEAVIQSLAEQVERTAQLLDSNTASEYLEALSLAPALVKRESRISSFLRVENFHTIRAANKLVSYWRSRKHFFGERWLLEMNQTGGTRFFASGEYTQTRKPTHFSLTLWARYSLQLALSLAIKWSYCVWDFRPKRALLNLSL